jgi:hypothetical protein
VHLYYEGASGNGRDGLFTVVQYDAESSRATYQLDWDATAANHTETGTLELVAARSGAFMNQSTITVGAAPDDLCTLAIADGQGRSESWRGVPRLLGRFADALNGTATGDPADPAVQAGEKGFYDSAGRYATSRLVLAAGEQPARMTLLSRFPARLQLANATVADVGAGTCTLTLTLSVDRWAKTQAITQAWKQLPVYADSAAAVLAGTSASYDYSSDESANVVAYTLATAEGSGRSRHVLVLARGDVTDLTLGISSVAGKPDRCGVAIAFKAAGKEKTHDLPDVERAQDAFAAAVEAAAAT